MATRTQVTTEAPPSTPTPSSGGAASHFPRDLSARATAAVRATAKATTFFLKVFPMLPSRPIDWVSPAPVVERVRYPSSAGMVEGDFYRPSSAGPHPGVVVCLGVVPFGVEHPQVAVLGKALARSGFAALLYWSPAMRDVRLDPEDVENIALAYDWLLARPEVDPARSGLLGTCVGGAFALMASAQPSIRDRVGFVSAYAPYSSMWTFARDIASATCANDAGRVPWQVDQLTRKVFIQSLTDVLPPEERDQLRQAFAGETFDVDARHFSADGQTVLALLTAPTVDEAEAALRRLSPPVRDRLTAISPLEYVPDIHAPLVVLLHDRGDPVIPVGQTRALYAAFGGRAGVHYTEMLFQHLDPVKGKLPVTRLARELGKFFMAVYPLFRQAVSS